MSFHATYKMENVPYDQYRYTFKDYIKNNPTVEKDLYNYVFLVNPSPYSFDNPIRVIDSITYIEQPTEYLCGQSVVAMLAGVSVDEVINLLANDKGTSVGELDGMLCYYGIKNGRKRVRVTEDTILPDICILSIRMPGYGHWSLYFKGKYYDPEFGEMNELPANAVLKYYWEIFN